MNIVMYFLLYKTITIGILIFLLTGNRKEKTKIFLKKLWGK
jgi:hypothetical protein